MDKRKQGKVTRVDHRYIWEGPWHLPVIVISGPIDKGLVIKWAAKAEK